MKESEKVVEGIQFQSEDEKLLLEEKESLRKLRMQREERLGKEKQELKARLEDGFELPGNGGNEKGQDKSQSVPFFSPSGVPARISKSGSPDNAGPKKGIIEKPLKNMLIIGAVIVFLLLAGGWGLIYGLLPAAEDAGNPINNHANIPVDPVEASLSSSRPAPENPESVSDSPVAFSDLSDSFKNSIEMEFVLIPAGEFLMGSPEEEAGRGKDEGPVHPVQIEKPFYLGKYEVTGEQWCEVMGTEPLSPGESELPAAEVSWEDVQIFIEKLNKLEGTAKYRLPSEAEWEYACRAGSSSRYSFGDEESKLAEHAWFESTPYSGSRHPVGLKEPNAWGLYDMHGNAWEWVQDTWHNDYSEAPEDGRAWEGGVFSYRVTRGGSVTGSAADCRAANRIWFTPNARSPDLGFRLLREA